MYTLEVECFIRSDVRRGPCAGVDQMQARTFESVLRLVERLETLGDYRRSNARWMIQFEDVLTVRRHVLTELDVELYLHLDGGGEVLLDRSSALERRAHNLLE